MSAVEELMQRALQLSVDDRELLVDQLLASIQNTPTDPNYDSGWLKELQIRMEEIDKGIVKPIPWREALAQIRQARSQKHT